MWEPGDEWAGSIREVGSGGGGGIPKLMGSSQNRKRDHITMHDYFVGKKGQGGRRQQNGD